MATLEVHSLSRAYSSEVTALRNASFTVEDGRVAAIIGPSGCGKTTLLRLIAGLDRPDQGDIALNGSSILRRPVHRRGVGMMFQDLALFPHMSVRDNIAFGLRMQKWSRSNRVLRVTNLMQAVGLEGKERRKVHELSGGEQQRVALARTLAPNPGVLLLDEPLGSLDQTLKAQLRAELRQVLKRLDTTALLVSHDLDDAVMMADDLIVMEHGEVLQAGALTEVLNHPASVRVAAMTGYVPLARGHVQDGRILEPEAGSLEVPEIAAPTVVAMAHPSALLGVPPDSAAGSGITGTVLRARALGPTYVLDLRVADRSIEVRWEWDLTPPPIGELIAIAVRPGTLRCFGLTPNDIIDGVSEITDEDDRSHMIDWTEPANGAAPAAAEHEERAEPAAPLAAAAITGGPNLDDSTPVPGQPAPDWNRGWSQSPGFPANPYPDPAAPPAPERPADDPAGSGAPRW